MKDVLLVDDEQGILITFSRILEKEGYTVKVASSCAEAHKSLHEHQFDAVISDILMPDGSGIDLLKLIKIHSPDTPVIMMTGEPNLYTAIESVREGAYDYLSKPVSRQQLCQAVGKAIEKKWLSDERKRLEQENLEYQKKLESKVFERTQSLEELNAFINNVIESVSSVLITLDTAARISMVNTHALELLHIKNKTEIIGKGYYEVFPQQIVQALSRVIQEEDWNTSHEFELENKTIGYNISLLLDNQQKIRGKVITMRDISEKKRLEQELIQSEKLAILGLLAGKISHEMGNPLFGIIGYAELLESKYPEEENIKYITNQALRLKKMTKDLLTLSKPKPPQIAQVDLNNILKETVGFLREVTGQIKYHEVIEKYYQNLPLIEGDGEQLKQVFINLIVNASQAMKDKIETGILTIGTTLAKKEDSVLVYVQDNGCGIAQSNIDRVFDPFYTTKGRKGTGLGMAVIKEIVNKHRGQIQIKSRLGEGTRVLVTLPIQIHKQDKLIKNSPSQFHS